MIPSSRVWIKNLDRFRKDWIGYSSELKPWNEIFLSPLNEIRTLRFRIGAEISEKLFGWVFQYTLVLLGKFFQWEKCVNFDTLSVICIFTMNSPSLMPPHPSTWTFGFFYYSWVIFVALESFVISCWVDFWDHPSSSSSPGDHPTSIVIGNIEKRG